jgi:hypothetical protein
MDIDIEGKTFFIDIDGTIVKHLDIIELAHYNLDPNFIQVLLPGVDLFFKSLSIYDTIIFTTARSSIYREMTERTLNYHNITFKYLIMDLSQGQRILINDTEHVLYHKAIGINVLRNVGFTNNNNF